MPSIEEQGDIADQLDAIIGIIAKRRQELTALDNLIKARFVEMFKNNLKKIGLIMGSINDYEKAEPAVNLCKEMGVDCMAHVYSAHRTPEALQEFLTKEEDNLGVIIAAAGKAVAADDVIKIGVFNCLTGQNAFGGQLELEGTQ